MYLIYIRYIHFQWEIHLPWDLAQIFYISSWSTFSSTSSTAWWLSISGLVVGCDQRPSCGMSFVICDKTICATVLEWRNKYYFIRTCCSIVPWCVIRILKFDVKYTKLLGLWMCIYMYLVLQGSMLLVVQLYKIIWNLPNSIKSFDYTYFVLLENTAIFWSVKLWSLIFFKTLAYVRINYLYFLFHVKSFK